MAMTNQEIHQRWRDAIIDMVRERLLTMSDAEFMCDVRFRIGTMTHDGVRRDFMSAVHTALDSHQQWRVSGVGVRDVFAIQKMMSDEFGFAIRR